MKNNEKSAEKLVVNRKDAARMLGGISLASMIRLEAAGTLKPVRLNSRAVNPRVFYRVKDILALVEASDAS